MKISAFLKTIFVVDALSCLVMGLGLVLGGKTLALAFGLPDDLVLFAGLALLPIGLFILAVASRERTIHLFLYAIIASNLLWVIESVVVIETAANITSLGTLFVAAQAVAVGLITLLETIGVLRAKAGSRSAQAA